MKLQFHDKLLIAVVLACAALIVVVVLSGCKSSKPSSGLYESPVKILPPARPATELAKASRVVLIGSSGGCPVYSNTVTRLVTTNCPAPPVTTVTVQWSYTALPWPEFLIYSSTNLMLPMAQWNLRCIVSTTQVVFSLGERQEFYAVKARVLNQTSSWATIK